MDPLSIGAALVGFISFAKDAVEVINDIKDASEERKTLAAKFSSLQASLNSIESRIEQVKKIKSEAAQGPFGHNQSTNDLLQRYDLAFGPDGYCFRAQQYLDRLFDENFKKALRKRDKAIWTWKKDRVRGNLEAAIDHVQALRDYLYDRDVQLQQEMIKGWTTFERDTNENRTIEILNWIYPPGHQPTDVWAPRNSSVRPIPDPFTDSNPVYDQWLSDASSRNWHLNCFGKPGAGKSHRARTVIYDLSRRFQRHEVPVLFIMFNQANELNQSLRSVFRRLLRQLLSQRIVFGIPKAIRELWNQGRLEGQEGPSEDQAREALIQELQSLDRKFIVVDALDEATGCRQTIHGALTMLRKSANACVFSTTRLDPTANHEVEVRCDACAKTHKGLYWTCNLCHSIRDNRFDLCRECYLDKKLRCNGPSHIMQAPDKIEIEVLPTRQEIVDFVRGSLKQELDLDDNDGVDTALYAGFAPSLVSIRAKFGSEWDKIPERVGAVADDSYLVADMIIKRLKAQQSFDGTKKILEELTSEVTMTYDDQYWDYLSDCLAKKSRENQKVAHDHFSIVSASQDLLTYQQLSHAVAIQRGDKKIEDFKDRCYPQQTVRKDTDGLLMIGDFGNPELETVTFFHRTLADFLENYRYDWFPDRDQRIFDACLAHIELDVFKTQFKKPEAIEKVLKDYPFASYAACFWGDHFRNILDPKPSDIIRVLEFLNNRDRKAAVTQVALHMLSNKELSWDVQPNATPLHVCAYFGLKDICYELINDGEDPNCQEETYQETPLHYACRKGHTEVVRILLDAKAKPNVISDRGRTPLIEAIISEKWEVFEMLLNHPKVNVNVDTGGEKRTSALLSATDLGKYPYVRSLLVHPKINVNIRGGWGQVPLTLAVRHLNPGLVECLLNHPKTDPTIKDKRIGSPLDHVTNVGNPKDKGLPENFDEIIVKMFLGHRNPPVLSDVSLQHLIERGRNNLLKLFLNKQNYADWKDEHDQTLLHVAARCSFNFQTFELIYDHLSAASHLINQPDKYGCTPLHGACWEFDAGRARIVELLLSKGADSLIKNSKGLLPIEIAYQNITDDGRILVDQLFAPFKQSMGAINTKPDVAIEDVVASGDADRLRLAVNQTSSPPHSDPNPYTGWTVLHWTMYTLKGPRPELLEILLPHYSQYLNSQSDKGRTCLHTAAQFNCDKAVELLIKKQADLEITDSKDDTALDIAQRSSKPQTCFLLIKAGAEIKQEGVPRDLIHAAISETEVDVVKRLVDIGVDIYHRKDGVGLTALTLAKNLRRKAVSDAKHNLSMSGTWLKTNNLLSFDQLVQDDPKVKAYNEIVQCLQKARRDETRGRVVQRDLTALIERLRREMDSGSDDTPQSPLSPTSPRHNSEVSPPPPYSQSFLSPDSFSPPDRTRARSRSRSYSQSRRDSSPFAKSGRRSKFGLDASNGDGKREKNDRLMLIAIISAIALAWAWLILHYTVRLKEL